MRIARFTTGDDPAYGMVDGDPGEKIAEITGDPLYQRLELDRRRCTSVDDVRLLAPVIPRSKVDRRSAGTTPTTPRRWAARRPPSR